MQQTIDTLSSGWVRRLGLVLALMPPVELILLDEPFVAGQEALEFEIELRHPVALKGS